MTFPIQKLSYTRSLPARGVAIATIQAPAYTPADMTDIITTVYQPGSLGVWVGLESGPATFLAPDLNQTITIQGSLNYSVESKFFEITNVLSTGGVPLYYQDSLPSGVSDVVLLDLSNNQLAVSYQIENSVLYHDQHQPTWIRYVDASGVVQKRFLQSNPVIGPNAYGPTTTSYLLSGTNLSLSTTGAYQLRFLDRGGYSVLPPYGAPPNAPWYLRVRSPLKNPAPEWAAQVFLPKLPYQLATWVPGTVLDTYLVSLERKQGYNDPLHFPDILVYSSDNVLKYALDGNSSTLPLRTGSQFPWRRNAISSFDSLTSCAELTVELAADDIVFANYSYAEPDVVLRALDINPFTNPNVGNRIIQIYVNASDIDPFHSIYYCVLDASGTPIPGLTNDPSPDPAASTVIASVMVGISIGTSQITMTDARVRGGGLAPQWQQIPESQFCWDLGFWDGKPYPSAGASIIYLPQTLLNTMTRDQIEARLEQILPLGSLAQVFYYDSKGRDIL